MQTPRERFADFAAYVEMAQAVGIEPINLREQAQQFTKGMRGGRDMRTTFTHEQIPRILELFRELAEGSQDAPMPTPGLPHSR